MFGTTINHYKILAKIGHESHGRRLQPKNMTHKRQPLHFNNKGGSECLCPEVFTLSGDVR